MGSLEAIDKEKSIGFKWLQKRIVLFMSVGIISLAAGITVYFMLYTEDVQTKAWAQNTFALLVGFSAGALWPSSGTEREK